MVIGYCVFGARRLIRRCGITCTIDLFQIRAIMSHPGGRPCPVHQADRPPCPLPARIPFGRIKGATRLSDTNIENPAAEKASESACPFSGGAIRRMAGGGTRNRDWWPNLLNLSVLRQHSCLSDPM